MSLSRDLTLQGAIGFEIWTMQGDIMFDNIYVGHSVADAKALSDEGYKLKQLLEPNNIDTKPVLDVCFCERVFNTIPGQYRRCEAI